MSIFYGKGFDYLRLFNGKKIITQGPLIININPPIFVQVNLVLDGAVEYSPDPKDKTKVVKTELKTEILLNGNQIAVLVPGGSGPPDSLVSRST